MKSVIINRMDNPLTDTHFQQPANWRWHSFTRANRSIRFGSAFPQDTIPDGIIICLHGVREFSEKYFETAHWALRHNLAFWTFDWAGQGKSTRFISHKRHVQSFIDDIDDLNFLIREYIKPAALHPELGRIPLVMLAHSMGANLGLRYVHDYPDIFSCAAFTAPMMGIKVFAQMPQHAARLATSFMRLLAAQSYIPHGHDWRDETPPLDQTLSSDPIRSRLHNLWGAQDNGLICGDVTYGWLDEAQKSCMIVQDKKFLNAINTPCLFALAGQEHLVDNTVAQSAIAHITGAKCLKFADSYHEILMERDTIRDEFLTAFYAQIKEHVINNTSALKAF